MLPQDEPRDAVPASLLQALADAAHKDLVARIWRLTKPLQELTLALASAPRPERWPRGPYWQWWYAVRLVCFAVSRLTWRRSIRPRRGG